MINSEFSTMAPSFGGRDATGKGNMRVQSNVFFLRLGGVFMVFILLIFKQCYKHALCDRFYFGIRSHLLE